jgi:hypothetical protein
MDDEFDKIYSEQVGMYRAMQLVSSAGRVGPQPDGEVRGQAMRLVDEAIERVLIELGPKFDVRADGRLFLMVNLTQLVAIPLLSRGPNPPIDRIRNTLVSDAFDIARAATRHTDGEREISAASMLLGAAEELQKLRLKEWRLWDRR